MSRKRNISADAAELRRRAEDDELRLRVQERTAELAKENEALRIEIIEHKRTEEELQDLSKFPSENPNPVLRIARDGTLLYINAAGLSLLPQWHLEVGHASSPLLREAVVQSIDNGSAQVLDLGHDERVYSFFVAPIVAARYANLYGREITDRKRAEEVLRESEARFRSYFELPLIGLAITSPEKGWIEVNDQICSMMGYSREELLRMTWPELTHPEDLAADVEQFNQILAGQIDSYSMDKRFIRKNGEVIWTSIAVGCVRDAGGRVKHIVALGLDITERKRAEERMQTFSQEIIAAREEERKQVSSVLHHDVGSLEVGVSAHLDAIEEDLRSGKPGEALKWTKRARKLFGKSVARLKELAVQLRPPELDTLGLCAALRQYFSQVTKHGGTRIHFRETLGRRRVSGDAATTLFRVAQETLTNAITHGDAKQVDVFLSASKQEVRLTVRDNGKGFSPSGQIGQATSRMGLRVMNEMAASSGGGFKIHSRLGKGTTVRVSLPFATATLGPRDVTVQKETVARRKTTRSAGRGSRPQKGSGA